MQIDFMTATMQDVIARSAAMHPSLMADALRNVASVHSQAAETMRYDRSVQTAKDMAKAARDMARTLADTGSLDPAGLSFSETVIAFGVACRLQCVPHNVALDIAARAAPENNPADDVRRKVRIEAGAPNIDCFGEADEIWTLAEVFKLQSRECGRIMFPARPAGYVTATRNLGHYAYNKATAMRCRARGDVSGAMQYEDICQRIYNRLPAWARW